VPREHLSDALIESTNTSLLAELSIPGSSVRVRGEMNPAQGRVAEVTGEGR
jgi:hypothetical protein